jgi:hypothetical protein
MVKKNTLIYAVKREQIEILLNFQISQNSKTKK